MKVLGLESSCDETACAVVEDGKHVLCDIIASQVAAHARFGGVVPEVAARHHLESLVPTLDAALARSGLGLDQIDGVAVTAGPGLIGALLVALQAGKAIAWARGLPFVGVHHHEGHLAAVGLDDAPAPGFPHLALLVSGGDSSLVEVLAHGRYRLLGASRDDAAGEALDKVGKLLGLGYPAGATIDRLAQTGDPTALKLPRPMREAGSLELSFSGLKTWMRTWIERNGVPTGQAMADVCASFQAAVVGSLVDKTRLAVKQIGAREVQIAGGVAANSRLRAELARAGAEDGFRVFHAAPRHCTDNAAMIAAVGHSLLTRRETRALDLPTLARAPLTEARFS